MSPLVLPNHAHAEFDREAVHQKLVEAVERYGPASTPVTAIAIEVCRANRKNPFELARANPGERPVALYELAIRAAVLAIRVEEGNR